MSSVAKYAVAAYGFFTVVLYGVIAVAKGTFFQKRTERQLVELQIGMSPSSLIGISHRSFVKYIHLQAWV